MVPSPSSAIKVRPLRQWRLMSSNLLPDPGSMVVGEETPPDSTVFVECDNHNEAYAALKASYKEACRYDAYDVLPEKLYGQATNHNASHTTNQTIATQTTNHGTVEPPTLDSTAISYAMTETPEKINNTTSAPVECLPSIVNNVPIIAFPTTDLFTDLVTSHGRSGFLDRLTVSDLTKMLCQCTPRINLHATTAFRNNFKVVENNREKTTRHCTNKM
jgi:hypothetical protein